MGKKKKKKKPGNTDYLVPHVEFDPFEEEPEEEDGDILVEILDCRLGFVLECMKALKEDGEENSPLFRKYETELHLMLALENIHLELIEDERDI